MLLYKKAEIVFGKCSLGANVLQLWIMHNMSEVNMDRGILQSLPSAILDRTNVLKIDNSIRMLIKDIFEVPDKDIFEVLS